MKLMTKEILEKIPPLYAQDGKGEEAIVYVKFFAPTGDGTWYATEYNPETREFFGKVKLNGFTELGYFSLDELESVRLPLGLKIERDLYFSPKPLKECK